MFVRRRVNKSGSTSVFLVTSHREVDKKHSTYTVVKSYGSSTDPLEVEKLALEAEVYKEKLQKERFSVKAIIKIQEGADIKACHVKEIGASTIYKELFERSFGNLRIKGIKDLTVLRDLSVMRIIRPASKRKTLSLSNDYGIDSLSHNQIYRQMDKLDDKAIAKIKSSAYKNSLKVLGNEEKLEVLFYDLTTIYFESDSKSDLKANGYSKDGKSQHVQVTLVMVVTKEGLPVDYELLTGNTYEGSTLIPVLTQLRTKYNIEKVTIVADSAMLSKANLDLLEAGGYKYIVAARVKNMTEELTKEMLDGAGYKEVNDDIQYKEVSVNGTTRLIFSHSKIRARKDGYKREEIISKIKQESGSVKGKLRGLYKKSYVKVTEGSVVELDEEKVQEVSKFDGYYGYYTNSDLSPSKIMSHYKGLWQVEQTFRITKHNLSIRPIYHYTDRRIKAHFALCFMSLSVVRTTECLLRKAQCYTPIEQLNHLFSSIKEVSLIVGDVHSKIMTDISDEAKSIFKALNITIPKRLTTSYAF